MHLYQGVRFILSLLEIVLVYGVDLRETRSFQIIEPRAKEQNKNDAVRTCTTYSKTYL